VTWIIANSCRKSERRLYDPATPVEASEYIKSGIPGATLTMLDAAHLSNIEQPEAYTNVVLDFLRTR